jgi:MOSC domain-containing protein YiiM/ferredoxin-NADP reductase
VPQLEQLFAGRCIVSRLISVNVGLPRNVSWRGATVYTAVWKSPLRDRRMVRRLNIDGDGQGDLAGHGGEHRAVMVYQLDSYRYWESQLHRDDFTYGQFGENFTVEGLPDDEVCIGDRYRIGGALFEVTQPRVTCYRVGIRMDEPRMASLLVSHRRPGFYFRVLEEGPVGAGDEIVKVAGGPEGVNVAEVDALLYLPGHPRDGLERALRISALSAGWKDSLNALLTEQGKGNAGLTPAAVPPPAWTGFRPLRVARIDRESANVLSFSLESPDNSPLPAALAGQSLIVKLRPKPEAPPVLRNYSLSGAPNSGTYRISVKRELNGVASNFLHSGVNVWDTLEIAAARGTFILLPDEGPVVLLSAGIGATPVMAMLHELAFLHSERADWWLHGARNRSEHAFALESHDLVSSLPDARSHIMYSRPGPGDRPGRDFDAAGHLTVPALDQLGVPPRGRLLRLRSSKVPRWFQNLAQGMGRRAWADPQRSLWTGPRIYARHCCAQKSGTADVRDRLGSSGFVRSQRRHRGLGWAAPKPPRTRGGLLGSGRLVVSYGRVPQLRIGAGQRLSRVRIRTARSACGRQYLDLLLPA